MIAIFSNTGLAVQKGQRPARWGLYTLLAFFCATTIVGGIYLSLTYHGPIFDPFSITGGDIGAGPTPKTQGYEEFKAYLREQESDPLKSITLIVIGLGGALFVRYRLQRMPDVEKKSVGEE